MKSHSLIFISFLTLVMISSCDRESEPDNIGDQPVKAYGTFRGDPNDIDKEKWGDFNLVLELNKSVYSIGEPINVLTYFENIGTKTITLDGILPHRSNSYPPFIDVFIHDTMRFSSEDFLDNLRNEDDIIIEPDEIVELMKFNLYEAEGNLVKIIGPNSYQPLPITLDSILTKGLYKVQAHYGPNPQAYWSVTDTLEFWIR